MIYAHNLIALLIALRVIDPQASVKCKRVSTFGSAER
jgi:hypothetical protein